MNVEKITLVLLLFFGSVWATATIFYKKGYNDSSLEWQSNSVKMGYAHYNTFNGMWEWKSNTKELILTNITTVVEETVE